VEDKTSLVAGGQNKNTVTAREAIDLSILIAVYFIRNKEVAIVVNGKIQLTKKEPSNNGG
jgi:hypothetical protein